MMISSEIKINKISYGSLSMTRKGDGDGKAAKTVEFCASREK